MQVRFLLFIAAFLTAFLLLGSGVMARQKPDTTSVIDTTSIINSKDSMYADSVKRVSDSLLIFAPKNPIKDTTSFKKLMTHPYLPMQTKPSFRINEIRIAPIF